MKRTATTTKNGFHQVLYTNILLTIFEFYLFFILYVWVFCLCTTCVQCLQRPREGKGSPRTEVREAGEMAYWMGALTALPEDLGSVVSTHIAANNHL